MDQTTDTADLTETEKYLSRVNEVSTDSDSDVEEVAHDALLGGIRTGLTTMTRTARQALSSCKNKEELDIAAQRIEDASLKLLKLEKSFMKTASIVSDVIEDLASDYEEDENESIQPQCFGEIMSNSYADYSSSFPDKLGSGDATSPLTATPHVFRVSEKNIQSVMNFKDRLSKEFHLRLRNYENGLTNEQLKEDSKFTALLKEIKLGKRDAEASINSDLENNVNVKAELETPEQSVRPSTGLLESIPFNLEELKTYSYTPYNEDNDMDHSVLPSIDAISKTPIEFPVRNKYCNHVFDKESIFRYISANPTATCPIRLCQNSRPLKVDHFVFNSVLTSHVRRKNKFE